MYSTHKDVDFKKLMEKNQKAIDNVTDIRRCVLNSNTEGLVGLMDGAFTNIRALGMEHLSPGSREEQKFKTAFSKAYDNALNVIERIIVLSQISKVKTDGNGEIKKIISNENYKGGFFQMVEKLPKEFEGKKPVYDLKKVKTAHGLIRYLHHKIIEGNFDPKRLVRLEDGIARGPSMEGLNYCRLNLGKFHLFDLENQIKDKARHDPEISPEDVINKPMQSVFEYYSKKREDFDSSQKYYIYLKKNEISAYVQINCHSTEIHCKFNGKKSYIYTKYNEYLNAAWRKRVDYLKSAMDLIGFKVKVNPGGGGSCSVKFEKIVANYENLPEKTAGLVLQELIRLYASSTDINCSLCHSEHFGVDECLAFFFENKGLNLDSKIGDADEETLIEYRKKDLLGLVKKRRRELGIEK